MKIAVMQPYFLPYLGYFQLIEAVDVWVSWIMSVSKREAI